MRRLILALLLVAATALAVAAAGFFDGGRAAAGFVDPGAPPCVKPSRYKPDPCPRADGEYFIVQCASLRIWHVLRSDPVDGLIFASDHGCNRMQLFDY